MGTFPAALEFPADVSIFRPRLIHGPRQQQVDTQVLHE